MTDEYAPKSAVAPDGELWVCAQCGKTAKDPYKGTGGTTHGTWDESCFVNKHGPVPTELLEYQDGRVVRIHAAQEAE